MPRIELRRDHPRFDMAMELALSISRQPMQLALFAEDCGLKGVSELRPAIKRLKSNRRLGVRTGYPDGLGRSIWREGPWPKDFELDLIAYWQQLYAMAPAAE